MTPEGARMYHESAEGQQILAQMEAWSNSVLGAEDGMAPSSLDEQVVNPADYAEDGEEDGPRPRKGGVAKDAHRQRAQHLVVLRGDLRLSVVEVDPHRQRVPIPMRPPEVTHGILLGDTPSR